MKKYNWLYPTLNWQNRLSVSRLEHVKTAYHINHQFISQSYEVLFMISGELAVSFSLREERLASRDVLFIIPGTSYRFSGAENAEVLKIKINRKHNQNNGGELYDQLINQYYAEKVSVSCHNFLEFYERVHDLQRILSYERYLRQDDEAREIVLKILNLLWACKLASANREMEIRREQIALTANFLKLICKLGSRAKTVESIAGDLMVTPQFLNSTLLSCTGKSTEKLLSIIKD